MCNRYQQAALQEAKDALAAIIETPFNVGSDIVHPQSPGLVVRQDNGQRILASMIWGFPLILADMKARAMAKGAVVKPKPVNNARTDKLGSGFWNRWTDPAHRCLIPLKAYAEAIGTKGRMTEAWMTVPDQSVFAVAGIWRPSAEWGDCYSMIMTEAAGEAATVHILYHCPKGLPIGRNRMWQRWICKVSDRPYRATTIRKSSAIGPHLDSYLTNPAAYLLDLDKVLAYVCKGVPPADAITLGLPKQIDGGWIIGKRAGRSQNVGEKVQSKIFVPNSYKK
jgi:putative SOS response-associated peptidase YedK